MVLPLALRYLINKSKTSQPSAIIDGEPQIGKSTSAYKIADVISMEKDNVEWDFEKYCAKSFEEFLEMIDKYENKIIVIEEAGFQLSSDEWYTLENRLFNKLLQTQGIKHNILLIVLPVSPSRISKGNREMIDMVLWVWKRFSKELGHKINASVILANRIKKQYWDLASPEHKHKMYPPFRLLYSDDFLLRSKKYTDQYLVDYKKEIRKQIKNIYKGDKRPKCVICGSRLGLKNFGENIFLCKFHEDYA